MTKTGSWALYLRQTLDQVREVQQAVLDRQRFRGFSGLARVVSGSMALAAAAVMAAPFYPRSPRAHVLGWGAVFLAASVVNGVALWHWFFHDPRVGRDLRKLRPMVDALPPLFVGAALTLGLIISGQYRFLFGVWMCMFGLSNLASRHVLPPMMAVVGLFYVACGLVGVSYPAVNFLNPWPMGAVFFGGEMAGGLVLHFDERRYLSLVRLEADLESADKGEDAE